MFTQTRRMMVLATAITTMIIVPVSATIINVPDDYSTIQAGINVSANDDTVLVQPDVYIENINFDGHNIVLGSLFLTTNDTSYISSTIIDGGAADRVIMFNSSENNSAVITGFTIRNGSSPYTGGGIFCYGSSPTISNNIITGNISTNNHGGGIYCGNNSNAIIINNTITDNQTQLMGGGISCYTASPTIANNVISGNTAVEWDGGGIDCYDNANPIIANNVISGNSARYGGGIDCSEHSSATITNNTIYGNTATFGGGIICWDSDNDITNTILWDNSASDGPEIFVYGSSDPTITYCDVEGGWTGMGNIDDDPLFVDSENGDFHLLAGSPCIDAGDPNSPLDPDSTRADIGALYFDQSTSVEEVFSLPIIFSLSQNYPNPFNPTTTISFTIEHPQFVTLKVYDLLGREVSTLVDEDRQAGLHTAKFDASDLSSGIYFYRLQAGDIAESKRMALLK